MPNIVSGHLFALAPETEDPGGGGGIYDEDFPMKVQFQSAEALQVRLPPFINRDTNEHITGGSDTVTLVFKRPDGSALPSGPHTATYDSAVDMWVFDISTGSFQSGEWRLKATSNGTNAIPKWASYRWGDYVNDISAAKTAADAIKLKTDNLPASPAAEGTVTAVNTKLGTPAGASVSADIAAIKSDTVAIKIKTDAIPGDLASDTTVINVGNTVQSLINSKFFVTDATIGGIATAVDDVYTRIGAPENATIAADIANIATATVDLGDVPTQIASLHKERFNRWKVQGTQLFIYEEDGSTIFRTFNLKDENEDPSGTRVFERVPV